VCVRVHRICVDHPSSVQPMNTWLPPRLCEVYGAYWQRAPEVSIYVHVHTAYPIWGDFFECCFKAQSYKLQARPPLLSRLNERRHLSFEFFFENVTAGGIGCIYVWYICLIYTGWAVTLPGDRVNTMDWADACSLGRLPSVNRSFLLILDKGTEHWATYPSKTPRSWDSCGVT